MAARPIPYNPCEMSHADRRTTSLIAPVSLVSAFIYLVLPVPLNSSLPANGTTVLGESTHDVQQALDGAAEGADIVLDEGRYRLTKPLVPKNHQRLLARGRVVLSGARQLSGFSRRGQYWALDGQTAEGPMVEPASEVCLPEAPRCNRPEDLFVDDVPLRHVARMQDLTAGSWYFDYAADRVVMHDDPTGRNVELSVTASALEGSAVGVTLRGLVIEKFATPTHAAAINGTLNDLTLEDLEVRFNHFAGIRTLDGGRARRNRSHHNGALGFIGAGSNLLIEDNEIDHNNTAGYNPYWAAGGSKWVHTDGLVVRGNHAHHNRGPGLWTDIDNIGALYERNRVHDNDLSGIFHEVSYRAVIRHNVTSRNGRARPFPGWVIGAGILVSSSSNVSVYGNELTDDWQGIMGLEDERGPGGHGPWVLQNLEVRDNIVRQTVPPEPGAGRSGIAQVNQRTTTFVTGRHRFAGNTYHLRGERPSFTWMGREVPEDQWRRLGHDVTGRLFRNGKRVER